MLNVYNSFLKLLGMFLLTTVKLKDIFKYYQINSALCGKHVKFIDIKFYFISFV